MLSWFRSSKHSDNKGKDVDLVLGLRPSSPQRCNVMYLPDIHGNCGMRSMPSCQLHDFRHARVSRMLMDCSPSVRRSLY